MRRFCFMASGHEGEFLHYTRTAFIRPPDIVVGGLTFYHGFFFLLFSTATLRVR